MRPQDIIRKKRDGGEFTRPEIEQIIGGYVGGPLDSTFFVVLYLYRNGFTYLHMGYASAIAWVLTVIILAITLVVLRSSGRWVYYAGAR